MTKLLHIKTLLLSGLITMTTFPARLTLCGKFDSDDDQPLVLREHLQLLLTADGRRLYVAAAPIMAFTTDIVFWMQISTGACGVQLASGPFPSTAEYSSLGGLLRIQALRNGRILYTLGYHQNAISWFALDSATGALSLSGSINPSVNGVGGLTEVQDFALAAHDTRLVTLSTDTLAWYGVDSATGQPRLPSAVMQVPLSSLGYKNAPHRLLSTREGAHIYVLSWNAYTIWSFLWDTQTGGYTCRSAIHNTWLPDTSGVFIADMCLSPDERFLYIVVGCYRSAGGSLAWFSRDNSTGTLSIAGSLIDSGDLTETLRFPRSMALNADGNYLFLGSEAGGIISWFRRDEQSGALVYEGATSVNGSSSRVTSIQVAPDGRFVYMAAGGIYCFSVDSIVGTGNRALSPRYIYGRSSVRSVLSTDIRGRNVSSSTPPQGVYLSGARHGRLILRKAFVR